MNFVVVEGETKVKGNFCGDNELRLRLKVNFVVVEGESKVIGNFCGDNKVGLR